MEVFQTPEEARLPYIKNQFPDGTENVNILLLKSDLLKILKSMLKQFDKAFKTTSVVK